MSAQNIHIQQFDNGLTLIGEEMPWLESAAFSIRVPSGCIYDPSQHLGLANFTCEMVQRGCGERNSREFVESLEWLGVSDSSAVNIFHSRFSGAMPAKSLPETLTIFNDMLRRPILPEEQMEDGRMVCVQDIRSIEDDLAQKAMNELRKRFLGDPVGRDSAGTLEAIQAIQIDQIRDFFRSAYRPNGSIISVAGKIDWPELVRHVDGLISDWEPAELSPSAGTGTVSGYHHIPFESQQTQIALVYESIPYSHPDYFLARAAVGVLSGGFGSRLFAEVREKRGLCYSIFASLHSLTDRGFVVGYAGTAEERAQETLDVTLEEITKLSEGITEDELDRVKVSIRSALVMQQESSQSRAGSNAGDWFMLNRVRSRDEINELIQGLTVDQVNQYLEANPPGQIDVVTIGPSQLEFSNGISATSTG